MAHIGSREAAFLSLVATQLSGEKIGDSLFSWREREKPSTKDFHLAEMIAYGSCRMALALDWIAKELTPQKKLSLKAKEKILLRVALYQFCFMDRIPLYAIANESVQIAKKYFHSHFAKFLNALIRKLEREVPKLPQSDSLQDLSVRYSYPLHFVSLLVDQLGLEKAKEVMQLQNQLPKTFYRVRPTDEMKEVEGADEIAKIAKSKKFYIQNKTPVALLSFLSEGLEPKRVLDLCSAPGGKLIWLHDRFPQASLWGNDPSVERLVKLKENCEKYGLDATITSYPGQAYPQAYTQGELFDLIVIDAPCSNSGVLHKRPEARWRLEKKELQELKNLQLSLISSAKAHLKPGGVIWYMTCSILAEENEGVVKESELNLLKSKTILPNQEGFDGGFAAVLGQF
jgi:16S rRNA (cytosine967-C5)-methyltransferase